MKYQAILFDLDGTLVDTITLYMHSVLQVLKETQDIDVTEEQFEEWYHTPLHMGQILALHGIGEDQLQAVRGRRDEIYEHLLETAVDWLPGAEDLLAMLGKKKPKTAVVTGSWMSYVDAIHRKLGVRKHFPHFITADEIHKFMKPHPHGLLLACDRLGVEPKNCLYIGDQQFDVDAAHAAGMPCWLVRGRWTPKKIIGADREFGSPGEMVEPLRQSL